MNKPGKTLHITYKGQDLEVALLDLNKDMIAYDAQVITPFLNNGKVVGNTGFIIEDYAILVPTRTLATMIERQLIDNDIDPLWGPDL